MAVLSSDVLVSSIQSEIQRVQDDLVGVEENLKRLTGRDFNEPRGERRIRQASTGGRDDEPPPKRRPPGGVFARLGEPVSDVHRGRRVHEVLEEGEIPRQKPSVASSVARPIMDGKSRTEAAAELTKDRASRDRNRRMFGALLGTLQRFRTEEAKQKGKDEQRAKIEKKLEEKGRAEKEELRRERLELINQRKERQLRIKRLNFKIERVKEHEAWESNQRRLGNFIRTQGRPRIFWIPKILQPRTSQLIANTKETIEKELEEARLQLKEELDEVLGGRRNLAAREEEEEEERDREGEGDNMDFNNGSDLLDYDAEEGELVYEDEQLLSGKKQKGRGERVVVQVESSVNRAPQRRVELVTVVANRNKRAREGEGNESEKENVLKSKVSLEARKVVENGGDKGKGRGREKEKKSKEKEREKSKGKEKSSEKKSSSEKPLKSRSSKESPVKKESKGAKKDRGRNEDENKKEHSSKSVAADDGGDVAETNEDENTNVCTDDLSQINLPVEPEPEPLSTVTQVVVQHVPVNSNAEEDGEGDEEMQMETVLIDTSHIKEDKTQWDEELVNHLPIIIKKEKDATPEKKKTEKEVATKPREKASDSSSDSSSDSDESSSESEESSSEDSSSGSSSSEDEKDKKKKVEKAKPEVKKKEKSSSSESNSDSSSEDEDDDDKDKAKKALKKNSVEGKKSSPKYTRKNEKEKGIERQNERKNDDRRRDVRRSRSRGRRSRSRTRSRSRRRDRSRSKDRRRDRR